MARNLATRQASGEIRWAPQLRELLAFQKIADVLGEDAAAGNLIGTAPEEDRDIVATAVHTVIANPTVTGSAVFPAAPGRDTLSAALTAEVPVLADRDDLLVTIAPGAGHGAPACYLPATAMIEVDGAHLHPVDPATARPHLASDRKRYAAVWGALTHECAHSRHTRWHAAVPDDTDPATVSAALLLKGPRIERAQIRRRPDDRHWLRACVKAIVTGGLKLDDPALPAKMTPRDAAHTAALFLGRADSGILTPGETAPVCPGCGNRARRRGTHPTAGGVARSVPGRRRRHRRDARPWPQVVQDHRPDPDTTPPHLSEPTEDTTTTDSSGPHVRSPLADAVGKTLGKVARAVARVKLPDDPAEIPARKKADAARRKAERLPTPYSPPPVDPATANRDQRHPPTDPDERTAARVLARA